MMTLKIFKTKEFVPVSKQGDTSLGIKPAKQNGHKLKVLVTHCIMVRAQCPTVTDRF